MEKSGGLGWDSGRLVSPSLFSFFLLAIYKAKKLHKEIKVLKISGFQVFQ